MDCFSCGKPIAHMWDDYLESVKKYEMAALATKSKPKKNDKTPEFLALAEHKVGRECCRRMFLCQHDMYDKVR